ncbi:hypothetical protein J3R83DRAFT_8120 [Lanmaoa asiatica]|nr:hypothetical protein J3R83DRAFT_8120 [Lanmaoa asiatica]
MFQITRSLFPLSTRQKRMVPAQDSVNHRSANGSFTNGLVRGSASQIQQTTFMLLSKKLMGTLPSEYHAVLFSHKNWVNYRSVNDSFTNGLVRGCRQPKSTYDVHTTLQEINGDLGVLASRLPLASISSQQHTPFDIVNTKVLVALTMNNPNGYNQDWSIQDMIEFMRNVIGEKEVICQWIDHHGTLCNNLVKGKDFKVHLHHRHGITSDLELYPCRWHQCFSQPMRRASLERHMQEQHVPARWACLYCPQTFSRERTMMEHIERTPGHP